MSKRSVRQERTYGMLDAKFFPARFTLLLKRLLHADLSHLQRDPHVARRARATAGNGFQSLVDLGARRPSPFSAPRSGTVESDQSQSSPHAPAFPPGAPRRSRPGQEFSA